MLRLLASIPGTRVTTFDGDFYIGTVDNDVLTMDATVIGLGGMAGNDTLSGASGDDILCGDFFSAEMWDGADPYDLSVIGDDVLFGGAGSDVLLGGPGKDSLYGGAGDDFYFQFSGNSDSQYESAGGGQDTVITSATTYTLRRNFENLEFGNLMSAFRKDAHGIGNRSGNWMVGGDGSDTLEGLGGDDSLAGGFGGRDVLIGGAGRDTFAFGHGPSSGWTRVTGRNADVISDFDSTMDRISLLDSAFDYREHIGAMMAGQFGLVGSVLTGKELVLYDQITGDLFNTDRGFSGPGSVGAFAQVTPGMVLTFQSFEWFSG